MTKMIEFNEAELQAAKELAWEIVEVVRSKASPKIAAGAARIAFECITKVHGFDIISGGFCEGHTFVTESGQEIKL